MKILSIAAGDFDGDGKLDLAMSGVIAGSPRTDVIVVILGNGSGTFKPPSVLYPMGSNEGPLFLTLGDLNHDGKPDIAAGNFGGGDVAVLPGKGDGTFQQAVK